MKKKILIISISSVVALAALGGGCGSTATPPSGTGAANTTGANSLSRATPAETSTPIAPTIETSEPNNYSATVRLTAMTTGKKTSLPAIVTNVARDGEKRRISFRLPNNEQVVYLNLGETRYLIMPSRRQYVEVDSDDVGFEIPRLMMPDQIVERLKGREGFERVGEEQLNGRTVVKYRAAGTTQTNSQKVGNLESESFTYVDKETGLPIRAELESRAEGNVQGVEGVRTIIEMSDIKTETAPALFEVPEGYNKITAEQIRNQLNAFAQAAGAVAGALLTNMNAPKAAPSPQK